MSLAEVVFEGARRRLRPVMMTASITAFGLVPMLLASGPGAEIQRPLAVVVIGGLVTATLLVLFVMPVLYVMIYRARGRPFSRRRAREDAADAGPGGAAP